MKLKTIARVLSWISALALTYFAIDTLVSLGDWGRQWAADPKILIIAFIVALPPACAVWLGAVKTEEEKATGASLRWFLLTTVLGWAWLYIGAIGLALLRLQ